MVFFRQIGSIGSAHPPVCLGRPLTKLAQLVDRIIDVNQVKVTQVAMIIIHESAGHAPILPDPGYRRYLQAFGAVGARAFSTPYDNCVLVMPSLRPKPGQTAVRLGRRIP